MAAKALMALDVGNRRIGVAVADGEVMIARPLTTLDSSQTVFADIAALVREQAVTTLIVGLPRNLDGDDTAQTALVRRFVEQLKEYCSQPIHFQDEALTSVNAEAELHRRGKPFAKAEVDALAATFILDDYVRTVGSQHGR